MKALLAFGLFAIAAFCAFGFLATYESVDGALGWRVGYGVVIVACLFWALRLFRGGGDEG